jgi:methionyl-tRNA synthetase
MPETGDADFSWREFFRRNNDGLVATYGNLAHRVLTFAYRNFEGGVPTPAEFDEQSQALLHRAESTLDSMDSSLYQCRFREAIRSAMALAQEVNRYLDEKSPWKMIKEERQAAATAIYVALSVLSGLKTMLYPFLPFSSQKLHALLGFEGDVESGGWKLCLPSPGQRLPPPEPLFAKLEERMMEEETGRLGHVHCL